MIKKILKFTFAGILFFSIKMYSQEFYVNTIIPTAPHNKVIKLNISNTNEIPDIICVPTPSNESYGDIAIDSSNNLYYVTGSGQLFRRNNNNLTCEYLGAFGGSINSLVADSGDSIYAVGSLLGSIRLFKYSISSNTFTTIGNLPSNYLPSGDLFFYENRLFLTINDGILEINMITPSQSCIFINSLPVSNIYGAFSINFGTYSKAYILSIQYIQGSAVSYLYEINMISKQISPPIKTYNHNIYGAAATYDLTSTNSTCTPTLSVQESAIHDDYFEVINPSNKNIICKTNIKREHITLIQLFDNSGRLIKDFSNQTNLENLQASNISAGIYLLTLSTKKGKTYTKKIIIKS